jgi:hypothetical protein
VAQSQRLKLNKQALFARLGYEPHPGQLQIHLSRASRRVLACGVRWGKTTAATMEAIAAALAPSPASTGWIVAPYHDVADRTFQRMGETIAHHFPHRVKEFRTRERKLVVLNFGGGTSTVRGKSADNPTALLGEGLDWLVLDEAARVAPEIWHSYLSQRLIDKQGWALIVSTPAGCNWFRDLYRIGLKQRDPRFESWTSPSTANPFLPVEAIEAERKLLKPDVFRQEYLGEFIGEESAACETCAGPRPGAPGIVVLVDDEEPRRCPDCHEPVDESGESLVRLWADGHGHLKYIRLMDGGGPFVPPAPVPESQWRHLAQ